MSVQRTPDGWRWTCPESGKVSGNFRTRGEAREAYKSYRMKYVPEVDTPPAEEQTMNETETVQDAPQETTPAAPKKKSPKKKSTPKTSGAALDLENLPKPRKDTGPAAVSYRELVKNPDVDVATVVEIGMAEGEKKNSMVHQFYAWRKRLGIR